MMFAILFTFLFAWSASVLGIAVTTETAYYTVNTESSGGLKVVISRTTCDIESLKFYGIEYQNSDSYSQIASGIGSATVSYTTSDNYVIVKCVAENDSFDLTHYFVFEDASDSIYMATNIVSQPAVGELRFIFRLTSLAEAYPFGDVSNTSGGTAIEANDVYSVGSELRSKFYSSERFIDDAVYCATNEGASIHGCFVRPGNKATEKSSGGPFFRDIDLNNVDAYQSVAYYMNSGHAQTESYRQGFHGPYVFTLSSSGVPKASDYDTSFFDNLDLPGYVGASGRGYVKGTASGVSSSFPTVLHWFNDK